MITLNLKVI